MGKVLGYISAAVLAGLLLLLTIGLPVTYSSTKAIKNNAAHGNACDKNPYSNSTEEKTPSGTVSVSEEYVHETRHDLHLPPHQISIAYIHAHEATYVAYHGEQHCPPPNAVA
ncbi:hypothetical protein ACLOAU_18900 [Niabella sp. CJ426]|jgi:hypothetical protein|uniref:hypothetical protein n=1 Tax=Niabella sp. CJ426 TaxID=3393740 RepID=UPI003D069F37